MGLRIRGLRRGELDGFLTCFQAAFGVDDQSLAIIRNSLVNDPYFKPERVRVGLVGAMVASHAVILHRSAYVGDQVVTVAGITAVGTHPHFQGRGFGTKVMRDVMRAMRRGDYHLAMLTTRVPGFFARFGFREAPKMDGYECPTSALANLPLTEPCAVERLDYERHWPALAAVYGAYSRGRTGMQVRDHRWWETWPRRGTFPHGFSSHLDACGMAGVVDGRQVAYLAAHVPAEGREASVGELAHLPGYEQAAAALLREAARRFLAQGTARTVIHSSGGMPLLQLLEERGVPLQQASGPGLMVFLPNPRWARGAGFRNADDAIERLFRSPTPILWHRDGY